MNTEKVEHMPANELQPVDNSPPALIRLALDRGADVGAIEKLVALQEHMEDRSAERAFNADMVECQRAMPVVVRDAENAHTRSRYARYETILQTCRAKWQEHGFSVSTSEEDAKREGCVRIKVNVLHRNGHSKDYFYELPIDAKTPKGSDNSMTPPQRVGSTYAYANRYAVCQIFNIAVADQDDDGQGAGITIDEKQVNEIRELAAKVGADSKSGMQYLLGVAGVDALYKMNQYGYLKVLNILKSRVNGEPIAPVREKGGK